jgi:hypothetical protein
MQLARTASRPQSLRLSGEDVAVVFFSPRHDAVPHVMVNGCSIASVPLEGGQPVAHFLARAETALATFRASGGRWSYLGDSAPTHDFDPDSYPLSGRDDFAELNHGVPHWSLERDDDGAYVRWLIWDVAVAERLAARLRRECGSSLSLTRWARTRARPGCHLPAARPA